jgi:hypothetical protein
MKITMDARILGDTIQVLFGIVPLISDHKGVTQNPFFYLPIILIDTKETKDLYQFVEKTILSSMKTLMMVDGEKWDVEWYLVADLCSLWKMTGLHWSSKEGFCLWCDATPDKALKLHEFQARVKKLEGTFGIPVSKILFCTLHMGLRITEKLLIWLFELIRTNATVSDTIAAIRHDAKWSAFTVLDRAGRLEVGGFITMSKVHRLLEQRHKIIDAAFGKYKPNYKGTFEIKEISKDHNKPVSKAAKPTRKRSGGPSKPKKIPPPSLHKNIQYEIDSITKKKMPVPPMSVRDIPSAAANIVQPEPMHIKEVDAAFLMPVEILSDNVAAPQFSKNVQIEDVKKIFDYWAWIVLNLEQKEITDEFCDRFELTAANFVEALKVLFVENHPTAYIHILFGHAGKMMRNHKGLWLYSQQGFEALHKFQKQIYLNHTTRGGADMDSSLQIFEYTYAGIYLWLESNNEAYKAKFDPQ